MVLIRWFLVLMLRRMWVLLCVMLLCKRGSGYWMGLVWWILMVVLLGWVIVVEVGVGVGLFVVCVMVRGRYVSRGVRKWRVFMGDDWVCLL